MDYHVLNLNNYKNEANIIFHFSVPDENNSVPINLRTALIQYLDYRNADRVISKVPNLQTADITEYDKLVSGEMYEHRGNFKFSNANSSLVIKRSEVDSYYSTLNTKVISKLKNVLSFWGMGRNI